MLDAGAETEGAPKGVGGDNGDEIRRGVTTEGHTSEAAFQAYEGIAGIKFIIVRTPRPSSIGPQKAFQGGNATEPPAQINFGTDPYVRCGHTAGIDHQRAIVCAFRF